MLKKRLLQFLSIPCSIISSSVAIAIFNTQAKALPGQTTEEVSAWIKAHPTLRPKSGEKLYIQKNDTAAQRFSFSASVLPPGRVGQPEDRSKIRTEQISMFDAVNGMTIARLQESLRVIYGLDIYQDFERSQITYEYPNQSAINSARLARTPIREALKGEIRVGKRFVYWVEVAQPRKGIAYSGHIMLLQPTDLDKLEAELRNR